MSVFKRYKGKRITPKHAKYAGARWWIYKRVKGHKTIHQSIPEARTKEQAELAERRLIEKLFNKRYGVADDHTTFDKFANGKYWQYVEQNNVNITAKRQYVRILTEHFKKQLLADISPQDCRDCQWKLQRGTLSRSSVNRIMSTASKIFSLACEEGILDRNPMQYVRSLKEPPPRKRLLTSEEKERLWDCLNADLFLRNIVALAVNLPIRKGQLLAITKSAVDFERRLLVLTAAKGRDSRLVPLNETATTILSTLCGESPNEKIFPMTDFRRRWKSLMIRAGINKKDGTREENYHFHDLRKELATELLRRKNDAKTIQHLYGHSDMSITDIYIQAEFEQMRAALNSLDATNVQPLQEMDGPAN